MKPDGNESVQELHFFYDAQSRPAILEYNDEKYRYIHNLQGDIIGLLDRNGSLFVEYKYDAWGKLQSTTGTLTDTLGKRNPFCYRSYVYDDETGLYYLRSRYYNPEWKRFINADDNIRGNLFEYSRNNPISRYDPSGNSSINIMNEKTILHNLVAELVARFVRGNIERTLTYTRGAGRRGGPGYPDVIVTTSNKVWEIKPKSDYGIRTGPKQMARYVKGGRLPGYAVTIPPFPFTLEGKKGMVYVTNGCGPKYTGVVYYEFKEYEESREPAYEPEPSSVVISSPREESSVSLGAVVVLGFVTLLAWISPVPGDEVVASAALLAALA